MTKKQYLYLGLSALVLLALIFGGGYYRETESLKVHNKELLKTITENKVLMDSYSKEIAQYKSEINTLHQQKEHQTLEITRKDGTKIRKTSYKTITDQSNKKDQSNKEMESNVKIESSTLAKVDASKDQLVEEKKEKIKKTNGLTWLGVGAIIGGVATCLLTGVCIIF